VIANRNRLNLSRTVQCADISKVWCSLRYSKVWCSLLYSKVWCSLRYSKVWCSLRYSKVWCSLRYRKVCCSLRYSKVWCSLRYSKVWCSLRYSKVWCSLRYRLVRINLKIRSGFNIDDWIYSALETIMKYRGIRLNSVSLKYRGPVFQVWGSRHSISIRPTSCRGVSCYLIQRYLCILLLLYSCGAQ